VTSLFTKNSLVFMCFIINIKVTSLFMKKYGTIGESF